MSMQSSAPISFAAHLASRGIVRVHGVDSLKFLQGLITNDMHHICTAGARNACAAAFLNGRGRVLFGTIIQRQGENDYLIDVDHQLVPSLIRHLKQYRLRADVQVSDESPTHSVWSLVGVEDNNPVLRDSRIFEDPRLKEIGLRAIVDETYCAPPGVVVADEREYTRLRILNGVPDAGDFANTPLPLDLALHLLNAVSFKKGCYLGQELTARSHFTGVVRKRITPVSVADKTGVMSERGEGIVSNDADLHLESGTDIMLEGKSKSIGKVSSSVDNIGLAVLRLADLVEHQGGRQLRLRDGRAVRAWRPPWWQERDNGAVKEQNT
ncbi:unnamed protein product [Agarophyton chilense]